MHKPLSVVDSCVHPFLSEKGAKLQEENCSSEVQRSTEICIQFNMISLCDWSCSPGFTKEKKKEWGKKSPHLLSQNMTSFAVFNSNPSSV